MLGVVGLVIGGIWAAASAVQTKLRTNAVIELFSTIQSKFHDLKKSTVCCTGMYATDILRTPPAGFTIHNNYYIGHGVAVTAYTYFDENGDGPFLDLGVITDARYVTGSPPMISQRRKNPPLCAGISKYFRSVQSRKGPIFDSVEYPVLIWNTYPGEASGWGYGWPQSQSSNPSGQFPPTLEDVIFICQTTIGFTATLYY